MRRKLSFVAVLMVWWVAIPLFGQNVLNTDAQPREVLRLREGWRFKRLDDTSFKEIRCDDRSWERVVVPHDWAIYGPFSPEIDKQFLAISQDGQNTPIYHVARTGGLPHVGVGWYRNSFALNKGFTSGDRVFLRFDGAMSNARVYVNGREVVYWPYGYGAFSVDVTDYIDPSVSEQTLAVRLENPSETSRWYPGAGLYRNVWVTFASGLKVAEWGTQITTPVVTKEWAQVNVKTTLENHIDVAPDQISVRTAILDGDREVAANEVSGSGLLFGNKVEQNIKLQSPKLWGIKQPNLYTALTQLFVDGEMVDQYRTRFGVRTIELRPDDGFYLNGEKVMIQGVCLHHDLGPLGGASHKRGYERQIRIMQDMGVNAIRTAHNMPAPELIEACNEMGMMVMAESFDEWISPKVTNGYHLYFDEWAERDLVNLARQFRNDPSIVMWSIGNEVDEQSLPGGNKVAYFLQSVLHREDPTRPVTVGMNNPEAAVKNNFASIMDLPGFNYYNWMYKGAYDNLPQRLVLGAETTSTVSSRGVYKFPVERRSMAKYDDQQCSSYDVEHCGWSNLPEDDFINQEDYHFTIGEFIWTGFDYLGEPTPYYTEWPSHSSYFGAVDLAGIEKDRFYLYRSHWNAGEETLHLLPHWNWRGREGEVTPIFVYTNYPTAELFINGKSQGKRSKDLSVSVDTPRDSLQRQPRYRLMWMDTVYEPGTVEVVAYDSEGGEAARKSMSTTGRPYAVKMTLENDGIKADGEDIAYVRVQVVDRKGRVVPDAANKITFTASGAGHFLAAANGDATCIVPFQSRTQPAFSGQLTAIVQSGKEAGTITLKATAKGLKSDVIKVNVIH
ncbi:MAG: DUF4982 domain-containing protein [Porphyromonas sp.]|nr:DUF4982 domain-containing protein [Porphyromonas sp.]